MNGDSISAHGVRAVSAAAWSGEIARSISSILLGLFLVVTLLIPAALVNKLLFVLLLGMLVVAPIATRGRVKVRTISPVIILAIFVYGYGLSFLGQPDELLLNQLVLSVGILPLIYVIDWYAIDIDRLVKLSGLALCAFTAFAVYAVIVVPESQLGHLFIDYFLDYSLGASGERSFSDSALFSFRIGPVAFLFLPFCLFLESFLRKHRVRDLFAVVLIGAVAVISTSRALVLGCVFAGCYLVLSGMRPTRRVVTLSAGAAVAVILVRYMLAETTLFNLTETSNSVKVGHVVSFVDFMTPPKLLFGDGLATTYFTIGFSAQAAQTEITLLDQIRYFGLPLTVLLYAALIFPAPNRSSYGQENWTPIILFLIYLLVSLTNPVLFNSYGLVVVIWYWSRILRTRPQGSA